VGDAVELPAQAGTYRFPAPHLARDMNTCGQTVGLVQETGSHALLRRDAQGGRYLNVARDGQPDEHVDGARLALDAILEPDRDQDLLGDTTEDRTDLRVSAAMKRTDSRHAELAVTVTNAGPLAADLPRIVTSLPGQASTNCLNNDPRLLWSLPFGCGVGRLAPGESRTVTFMGDAPGAETVWVSARSEGPDLAYGDNETSAGVLAAPAFAVRTAASQKLSRGVKLTIRAARTGRARVTVAVTARGRAVKLGKIVTLKADVDRTVTVRASGAKLRSLRKALRSGSATARITVRTIRGQTPVTTATRVTR
jgi:hypothetical protein